jgi:hypothetical protein
MKIFFLLPFVLVNALSGFSQSSSRKSEKSIYVLYGHHFKTNYIVDSGNHNLVGRKNVFSAEIGLNLDYNLNKKWKIRTGINGHLLFLNEVTYGVKGSVPPGINPELIDVYGKGIEYIESTTISIPVKVLLGISNGEKYSFSFAIGPSIGVYFPASNEMAGVTIQRQNGTVVRQHWVTRYFKNHKTNKSLGISYPQLEWDGEVECNRKFKKYGSISLGIKAHIGTRRLEYAEFVIWPNETNYKAKGHFKLNRSYIGVYAAFTFGKNK